MRWLSGCQPLSRDQLAGTKLMGTRVHDLTGQRFGRWTVLELVSTGQHTRWLCQCDCGKQKAVAADNLKSGKSQSCGCLHAERCTTHGQATLRSGAYRSWAYMLQRCHNPGDTGYCLYGGRGITVCDCWHKF